MQLQLAALGRFRKEVRGAKAASACQVAQKRPKFSYDPAQILGVRDSAPEETAERRADLRNPFEHARGE